MNNKKEKSYATYKEFGKMLRSVAELYSKMGDIPLCESGEEKAYIAERISFIAPEGALEECIMPLREMWAASSFDVDIAKRWGEYVIECREKGVEPDCDNWK